MLTVRLYFNDGSEACFEEHDRDKAQELLNRTNPGRIFSSSCLIIGGAEAMCVAAAAKISRIDFTSDGGLVFPLAEAFASARLVTDSEQDMSGASFSLSYQLVGGSTATAWSTRRFTSIQDVFATVNRMFEMPIHQISHGTDGMTLINPSNITRVTVTPGAKHLPSTAWEMASVDRSTAAPP